MYGNRSKVRSEATGSNPPSFRPRSGAGAIRLAGVAQNAAGEQRSAGSAATAARKVRAGHMSTQQNTATAYSGNSMNSTDARPRRNSPEQQHANIKQHVEQKKIRYGE